MSQARDDNLDLTREQIEVFAAGLYHLATCDGVAGSEVDVIMEFLDQTGAHDLVRKLPSLAFDPARAYTVLESSWLRSVFLRAALLIVRADGKVSDAEKEALSWMAMAFGIEGGFDGVVAQVEGQTL